MTAFRVALAAALVAGLGAFAPAPPPTPSGDSTGDPAVVLRLRTAVADLPGQGFAAVVGDASTSAAAAIGTADADRPLLATTPQEIGSVTKSMTGLLFADAVERGEVSPGTTLGDIHADLPRDLAVTTLAELATHTSGLPRLSTRAGVRALVTDFTYGNPYAWDTPDSLLADAGSTPLRTPRGEYSYSNLGYALLGQALAVRAGIPYPQLLADRVVEPLGMTDTVAAPYPLPANRAVERGADGRRTAPWRSTGSVPAGIGVYSTAADLGRLAAAAAAGDPPGSAALKPVVEGDGSGVGWGWFTTRVDERTLVGNNGATYGVQSSIWVEPASGRWVAVTSPSGSARADTQTIAWRLLGVAV